MFLLLILICLPSNDEKDLKKKNKKRKRRKRRRWRRRRKETEEEEDKDEEEDEEEEKEKDEEEEDEEEDEEDEEENSEDKYDDENEDDNDEYVLPVEQKKRCGFEHQSRRNQPSFNEKIINLKCSEAFAQVEAWEEMDNDDKELAEGRYCETFYPLAVIFTRCVKDNVSLNPYSDLMDGHHLKKCLKRVLAAASSSSSRSNSRKPMEWLPNRDKQVRLRNVLG